MERAGEGVRIVYSRISLYLSNLAADFGVELSSEDLESLSTVLYAFEAVDRVYDGTDDEKERDKMVNEVLLFLRGQDRSVLPVELIEVLTPLRDLMFKKACTGEFIDVVKRIFYLSDMARDTENVDDLINGALVEGELSADLILMLMNDVRGDLAKYWKKVFTTGNLGDDLFDARTDFAKGERKGDIKTSFYLRGGIEFGKRVVDLVLSHPNKFKAAQLLLRAGPSALRYRA